MKKYYLFTMHLGMIIFFCTGCKTPKQTTVEYENVKTFVEEEKTDTNKIIKTTTIRMEPTATGGKEITIHQEKMEVKSNRGAARHHREESIKKGQKDNFTPKMTKLENKRLKDSLNHDLKMKKQEVKEIKAKNNYKVPLVIICSITIIIFCIRVRNKF